MLGGGGRGWTRRRLLGLLGALALGGCTARSDGPIGGTVAPTAVALVPIPAETAAVTPPRPAPSLSATPIATPAPTPGASGAGTPGAVVVTPLSTLAASSLPPVTDRAIAQTPAAPGPLPMAFSPDGSLLAVAQDGAVHLYAVPALQLLRAMALEGEVRALAFSPGGDILAAGGAGARVLLWRVADGMPLRQLAGPEQGGQGYVATALAFSPDGNLLAAGSLERGPALWRVADGAATLSLTARPEGWGELPSVAFARGGALLSLVDTSYVAQHSIGPTRLRFWDIAQRRELVPPIVTQALSGGSQSADGSRVAFAPDGYPQVWEVGGPGVVSGVRLLPAPGPVVRLVISADGSHVAATNSAAGVCLWRAADGALLALFKPPSTGGQQNGALSVALAPDGRVVATLNRDGLLRLWEGNS